MSELSKTYQAVQKLLELLRCDHCNVPLHEPFTTGVCDHLLCPQCRLGGTLSRRNESCPVCHVPVRPKDCQLHPQIAQLVLVARRLKKLMSPEALQTQADEGDNEEIELGGDKVEIQEPVIAITEHDTCDPHVTLKRAYVTGSSHTSLLDATSIEPNVTLKRGTSKARGSPTADCSSLSSVARTYISCSSSTSLNATSTASITRKPRLDRSDARLSSTSRSLSGVRRLPGYRGKSRRSISSTTQSKENSSKAESLVNDSSVKSYSPDNNQSSATHGVNSDSLELVLKAATRVHNTRRSLKREAFTDVTTSTNIPTAAPVASPENSCLTDVSRISPKLVEGSRVSTVTLKRLDIDTSSTPVSRTNSRSSSRLRFTKSKNLSDSRKEDESGSSRSRSFSSSRFAQFLHKFRPNSKGESALHRAAIRGNMDQLNECLTSGMSPDVRDHAGWTPLHEAVLHGHRDIAEALLKAGATVDIPGGPDLDTPLHDAIQNAQFSCCELLLAHGADPILPNGAGFTPLQLVDLSLNKLNESMSKGKSTSKNVRTNAQNTTSNALMSIRDCLICSIDKRYPPTDDKSTKLNEPVQSALEDVSKHLSTAEALNPSLSISFKERRRLRPVLLGTGLNRNQQLVFSRVASMIRAQVVTNISPEVTHVITGATAEVSSTDRIASRKTSKKTLSSSSSDAQPSEIYQTSCPRTLKFLNAVLQGCWVLSFDWIETCAHVKMRVEEEGFEVTGCSTTPHSGAPRRARLAREAGSLGLFYGFRFCFLGQFEYPMPPRNELARLVRTGGAVVVFCRERCSPLRLARLAIECSQPNAPTRWELVSPADHEPVSHEQGDTDGDAESDDERFIFLPNQTELLRTHHTPLLVVYDSRSQTRAQGSNPQIAPYAVKVISDALSLIRPCPPELPKPDSLAAPLRAIPASWILDCVAEYTILPLSTF